MTRRKVYLSVFAWFCVAVLLILLASSVRPPKARSDFDRGIDRIKDDYIARKQELLAAAREAVERGDFTLSDRLVEDGRKVHEDVCDRVEELCKLHGKEIPYWGRRIKEPEKSGRKP